MPLTAVTPSPDDEVRTRPQKRIVRFKYNWLSSINECGRIYVARINDALALNVQRRAGTRAWEYLVIGWDLTKREAPLIYQIGTRGTMAEAKYEAENWVPPASPGTQIAIDDEVPF